MLSYSFRKILFNTDTYAIGDCFTGMKIRYTQVNEFNDFITFQFLKRV